ncbi:MAG: hypothetical protein ACYC49_17190 [Ignavibacteriaceae bacterium]
MYSLVTRVEHGISPFGRNDTFWSCATGSVGKLLRYGNGGYFG